MKQNRLTIVIKRPVAEVFDFTINPQNTPKWIEGIVKEETSSQPISIGTKYRNRGQSESWTTYIVSALEHNACFELTSEDKKYIVRYSYKVIEEGVTELEYFEWVEHGDLENPFEMDKMIRLKEIIET